MHYPSKARHSVSVFLAVVVAASLLLAPVNAAPPTINFNGMIVREINPRGFGTVNFGPIRAPVDLAFLPDGRVLVSEKRGCIRMLKPATAAQRDDQTNVAGYVLMDFLVVNMTDIVDPQADRGLDAIGVDTNNYDGYVYLYYVVQNGGKGAKNTVQRLTRMPLVGDFLDRSREEIILGKSPLRECPTQKNVDCLPVDSITHSVCNVHFLPDGNLLVVTGDASDYVVIDPLALRVQDLDMMPGKVLRITKQGLGLPDNPFYNGNPRDTRSKVWAYGYRNPFRSALKPGQPANLPVLYACQVGWVTWESLYVIKKGHNGGWPCYEGFQQTEGYNTFPVCVTMYQRVATSPVNTVANLPIWVYNHNGTSSAILGAAFTDSRPYGPAFNNMFWFGEYVHNELRMFRPTVDDKVPAGVSPDNALGFIFSPVCFKTNPIDGRVWITTIWDSMVLRVDRPVISPTPRVGPGPTRTPRPPPPPIFVQITSPTSSSARPRVGDTIIYAGVGRNVQGQIVDPTTYGYTWTVILNHCYPDISHCHMHFLFQAYNTPGGNFVFPDHDDGSYVSIQLQAFDPATKVVVGQATVNLFPQTMLLTLDSCVPNLEIEYSAYQGVTPYVLNQAMINGQRTISTGGRTFFDSVTNHTFSFVAWDDCNPNFQRDLTVSTSNSRRQAIFV